jgi:uncharacterized LabA/DUF88 family protein
LYFTDGALSSASAVTGIPQVNNSGKTALLIDGQNFYYTAKALGLDVDYKRLLEAFSRDGLLTRAYFYITVVEGDDFPSVRPLVDWLDYNGYTVRAKSAKEFDDGEGRRKFKRSIGVELTVDALELAPHVDRAVLCTGDGDYRALAEALQRRGVHVTVVSTIRSKPPMIADDLRRQADTFVDLDDLRSQIGRSTAHFVRARERKIRNPVAATDDIPV